MKRYILVLQTVVATWRDYKMSAAGGAASGVTVVSASNSSSHVEGL